MRWVLDAVLELIEFIFWAAATGGLAFLLLWAVYFR